MKRKRQLSVRSQIRELMKIQRQTLEMMNDLITEIVALKKNSGLTIAAKVALRNGRKDPSYIG